MRGIPLGKPKERWAIGDALRGALENEVDTGERDEKTQLGFAARFRLFRVRAPLTK